MKILSKFACWFNTKWGWFFTNGNKLHFGQTIRKGEVHYEIANGWAGWFVIEKIHHNKSIECLYHPLHYLQEGRFEQGQTVFFTLKCESQNDCEHAWITGLC